MAPLHYTTTTAITATTTALHHTTSSSCGEVGDHCNRCSHSKKHNSNHLSVHQWIRSAIRDSQQPTSPIGLLFLKLLPPPWAALLVYIYICICNNSNKIFLCGYTVYLFSGTPVSIAWNISISTRWWHLSQSKFDLLAQPSLQCLRCSFLHSYCGTACYCLFWL